jgi:hypothetical protein
MEFAKRNSRPTIFVLFLLTLSPDRPCSPGFGGAFAARAVSRFIVDRFQCALTLGCRRMKRIELAIALVKRGRFTPQRDAAKATPDWTGLLVDAIDCFWRWAATSA